MVHDPEIKYVFSGALDLHDARIAELEDLFAVCADQVVVLAVFVGLFELGKVLPKLVFDDQPGVKQYFDIVVQSRPAYPVLFILHHKVQLLYVKMSLVTINFIQDGEALRGLSVLIYLQVICQDLVNRFLRFLVHSDFKDTII